MSVIALDEPAPLAAPRRHVLRSLLADRWATAGGVIVILFILMAIFAPVLSSIEGSNPYSYHLDALTSAGLPVGAFGGASSSHWFGIEPQTGRDMFAIVAYGARTSLLIGFGATILAAVIGVAVGVTAGFKGGFVDSLLARFTDTMIAFPQLIFMIALGSIVPASFPKQLFMIFIIGVFGWTYMARVVRGQTLALRNRSFVVAAEAVGAPPWHLLRKEILPNLVPSIIVIVTLAIPAAIGAAAALAFLGVGVPPPTPSWGREMSDALNWYQVDPWMLLAPGFALFLVTLSLNALGDGLRDVFDPRMARR